MENNTYKTGSILKYLRKDRHLMQKELCSLLNVTEQAYSNYETGKRMPDPSMLLQLANFYQIDFSLFLAAVCSSNCISEPKETVCSEEPFALHTISVDAFILLDQYHNLSSADQKDILFYTKMKANAVILPQDEPHS